MRFGDIRSRIWLAAMLPVTLVVLVLVAAFVMARMGVNEEVYNQSIRSMVRQLAASCEYGIFSDNRDYLQTIARAAVREPDLRSVVILDVNGAVLAKAGEPAHRTPEILGPSELQQHDAASGSDLFLQPVRTSPLQLDTLFEAKVATEVAPAKLLGHVLVEVSRDPLHRRIRELLWWGLALALAGLLLGGLLALRLGQGVIGPVARVSGMIERIRRGDFAVRAAVSSDDPMRDLQQGLNQMAESLEAGREQLEHRVALATQALREKKEEAEMATLAKSRFLAAASHDLRQPTHALGMFVTRLGQLEHSAETRHLIADLERALQAMRDRLDGLLDVSRLDAGAVQVQLQSFGLNEIFEQLRVELGLTAASKGLRLRIRSSAVRLESDPALLHRILSNLIGNALRYTDAGGVLVACRQSSDSRHARIEVRDSGIGIAPEHQQAIFREFYQVANLERNQRKGLGLGLNIVQRTAQLLGHRLQLKSRPGSGSCFSLEVPLASSPAVSAVEDLRLVESFDDLVGLVVLVIEDDALVRAGLTGLLGSWGMTVIEAESLVMALQLLEKGPRPDVIVSDYRFPDSQDGLTAVRKLRSLAGQSIPAFLISGDTDPALLLAARQAGLTMLHKPVRPAKLRSLIRRLMTSSQSDQNALT
jgi:signal transduction histidine kinase/ActR/RegA family two-component response regulator